MDCDSGLSETSSETNRGLAFVAESMTSEGTSELSGGSSSSMLDAASEQTPSEELSSMFEALNSDYSFSVVTLTEELRVQRQDLVMYYETLLKVQEEKWEMVVTELVKEIEELHVDNQHMKTSLSYREIKKCQVCHADCIVTPMKKTVGTQTSFIDTFHFIGNKPRDKNCQHSVSWSSPFKPKNNIFSTEKNNVFSFTPVLKATNTEENIVTQHIQSSDSSRDSALKTGKSHLHNSALSSVSPKSCVKTETKSEKRLSEKLELVFGEERVVKLQNLYQKYRPYWSRPARDAENTVIKTSDKECNNNGHLSKAVGNHKHGDIDVLQEENGESHNTNPVSFVPAEPKKDQGSITEFTETPVFTFVGHKVSS